MGFTAALDRGAVWHCSQESTNRRFLLASVVVRVRAGLILQLLERGIRWLACTPSHSGPLLFRIVDEQAAPRLSQIRTNPRTCGTW